RGGPLHVIAVQALHVLGGKNRGLRYHSLELASHRVEVMALEHLRLRRRLVRVVREKIPRAKLEGGEFRERNEVRDLRHAALGALAEPDRSELRQRSNGEGFVLSSEQAAGDECCGDGTETRQKDGELALGRRNAFGLLHDQRAPTKNLHSVQSS